MSKYIADYIKNNTKSVFNKLTKPQKSTIKKLIYRVLETGSPILRVLGDTKKNIPKTVAQKFSYHLGKINVEKEVEDFADRRILKFLQKDGVISYDLSDISKEHAKKIECIGKIFDGSKRKPSNGFFLHGVGFEKFLFRLKIHDGERKFLPQVRKEILEKLIKITKPKTPIFVFDRGNDSNVLFEFLLKKSVKFIVRLKSNRKIILEKTGEILTVKDLKPGKYVVVIANEKTKQKNKKKFNKFLLVIKKNKEHHQPMRLLCSIDLINHSIKKITNLYLERWGVENSFKQIKTGLNLEKIRVLSFQKFKNLVSLMHFCSLLNEFLFAKTQKKKGAFFKKGLTEIFIAYEKFKKRYYLSSNSHSFLIFLRKFIPTFRVHRKIRSRPCQPSLFRFQHQKLKLF